MIATSCHAPTVGMKAARPQINMSPRHKAISPVA